MTVEDEAVGEASAGVVAWQEPMYETLVLTPGSRNAIPPVFPSYPLTSLLGSHMRVSMVLTVFNDALHSPAKTLVFINLPTTSNTASPLTAMFR